MIFSGVVLAAGRSTRMGRDKAFLKINGELLLARQLRCLREAGAAELFISGRRDVNYSGLGAQVVYDEYPDRGPLAGIAAVLKLANTPLLLPLAVDMPAMTSEMLLRILSFCDSQTGCVPFDRFGIQPLAAVYPKAALPFAETCLQSIDFSMRAFAKGALYAGVLREFHLSVEELPCFVNWNQPSEWPMDSQQA